MSNTDECDYDRFVEELYSRARKRQAKLDPSSVDLNPPKRSMTNLDKSSENLSAIDEPGSKGRIDLSQIKSPCMRRRLLANLGESNEELAVFDEPLSSSETINISKEQHLDSTNYSDVSIESTAFTDESEIETKQPCLQNSFRAEPIICNSDTENEDLLDLSEILSQEEEPPTPSRHAEILSQEEEHPIPSRHPEIPSQEERPPTPSRQDEISKNDNEIRAWEKLLEQYLKDPKHHGDALHLDAEKNLLEFKYRRSLLAAELKRGPQPKPTIVGSLEISNIQLSLTDEFMNVLHRSRDLHAYTCLVQCGREVYTTNCITTNSIRQKFTFLDGTQPVNPPAYNSSKKPMTTICFDNVQRDFHVSLDVYELIVPDYDKSGTINKLVALTPSKKKAAGAQRYRFRIIGNLKIKLDECHSKIHTFTFQDNPPTLDSTVHIKIYSKPKHVVSHSNLVNVRIQSLNSNTLGWDRRMCLLSGGVLKFWRPNGSTMENGTVSYNKIKPLFTLDLATCVCESVLLCDFDDSCLRKNTFALYSARPATPQQIVDQRSLTKFEKLLPDHKLVITKHQIQADSKDDLKSWCSVINITLENIRIWNAALFPNIRADESTIKI